MIPRLLRPAPGARVPVWHGRALVAALLVLSGCASMGSTVEGDAESGDSGVGLLVQNRHWRDVVVFVTRGGARNRLGMVTSNSSRDFRLRQDFVAGGYTVTLRVEVVGSDESLRSGPVTVSRGSMVIWRLRPVLTQSDVSVRVSGGTLLARPTRGASPDFWE